MPPLLEKLERLPIDLPEYKGSSPPFSMGGRPQFYKELADTAEGNTARTHFFEKNLLGMYLALGRSVPYAFRTKDDTIRSLDAGCIKFLLNRSPSEVELIRDVEGYIIAVQPLAPLLSRYERMREKLIEPYRDLTHISRSVEVIPKSEPVDAAALLASLRPNRPQAIMDVVQAADIDVGCWSIKRDGSPVQNPRANPAYCYEWAFGGSAEPTALCVWHKDLKVDGDELVYDDNFRKFAVDLEHAASRSDPGDAVASRARTQAKRSWRVDALLQEAFRSNTPLRVILLEGDVLNVDALGVDRSQVRYRLLDPEPWMLQRYNSDDGRFRLVRGLKATAATTAATPTAYVDQWDIGPAERIEVNGTAFARSDAVRRTVKQRAAGRCELCGNRGFLMPSGELYLETHHVIPLSEDGPDAEWNVVALCPNDHRRAHLSVEQTEIQVELTDRLADLFSTARDRLLALRSASTKDEQKAKR